MENFAFVAFWLLELQFRTIENQEEDYAASLG